jgi:hypothetical protein
LGLAFAFHVEFPTIFKITLCSKTNMRSHAFSLAIFAQQKKSKIETIPLTFLNDKQQKDNHTHKFFCTLHSTKEQNWNNSSHFSK